MPRFINSNDNFPQRHLFAPEYLQLLVGIHNNYPIQSMDPTGNLTSELLKEGLLVRGNDGIVYNNSMVIQTSEGQELFALAERYSDSIQNIVISHLMAIKNRTSSIAEFSAQPFLQHSFLILSNVILDNWQIRNIEKLYLREDRPLRGGKRFYIAIMENSQNGKDPFGIYGNISRSVEKNLCCFYGNNQKDLSPLDFAELPKKNNVFMFSHNANEALSEVALIVRDDLTHFFQSIDEELKDYHAKSLWAKLTYGEFFIWWYHFLYTQVTNDLAHSGHLLIPDNGMFPYIIKKEQ